MILESFDGGKIRRLLNPIPADGAAIPIRLGFKDIGNVTGRYWVSDSLHLPMSPPLGNPPAEIRTHYHRSGLGLDGIL